MDACRVRLIVILATSAGVLIVNAVLIVTLSGDSSVPKMATCF